MSLDVRVGYYSMSGAERDCDASLPENIAAGALTHINLAFAEISEDFEMTDENGPIVARTSRLKKKHPGLRVNIAIGASMLRI
jgi:GH18 family chitinase